ncbi:hypothetical protein J6590_084442, partial [Homalodisca vitripennis]
VRRRCLPKNLNVIILQYSADQSVRAALELLPPLPPAEPYLLAQPAGCTIKTTRQGQTTELCISVRHSVLGTNSLLGNGTTFVYFRKSSYGPGGQSATTTCSLASVEVMF